MFCFHKWKVISVSITPSFFDKVKSAGGVLEYAYFWMFHRKKIVVLKCQKCGMIKQKEMNEDAMVMYESENAVCGSVPVQGGVR